ncbi:MAG: O-antigen ligase family protein [Cyanobacteria bacterium P01_D01_bin.56]
MTLKLFAFIKPWWHRSKTVFSEGTPWKGSVLLTICLVTFVIYTWLPFSYFEMVGWPWIIPWQLGFLCAGGSLLWMLRQFKLPFQMLGYSLDWLVLFTASGLAISAAFSEFPTVAAWNLVLVFCYFVVLYGLRNTIAASPNRAYLLWIGIAVCGAIAALVSLSYWRPDPSMWVSGNFRAAIRNPFPLGHHNFVGGYFALVFPMILNFAAAQKGLLRWGLGLASAITVVALYVSGSRGAYVGFLVYVLVAMAIALWRSRGAQRKRLAALCLIGLLIIGIGIGSNPRVRDLISGIQVNSDVATVQVGDGPTKDRWFMLRTAANILRDRPLLGVGPGNMSRVSHLYRPIETGAGLDHVQQLHNTPAQLAGELGMWGIAIYLGWIGLCGWLWLQIYLSETYGNDRWLLYGIGGSFLAYGVSSLTDYQLENFSISITLASNTILLIYLANRYLIQNETREYVLPNKLRRIASLGVFALIAIALRLWLPMDTAVYLGHLGTQQEQAGNFVIADQRWTAAANLIPWDPTYNALAGQKLYDIIDFAEDDESEDAIQSGIIEHFQLAFKAAPNDFYFNHNLAVLYLNSGNFEESIYHSERAVQLLLRNEGYPYFVLGQAYLNTNRLDDAVTAFALQSLSNPTALIMPFWTNTSASEIHEQVFDLTQTLNSELLASLDKQTAEHDRVYENQALLNWLFEKELPSDLETSRLRPIVQALLQAEAAPQTALDIIESALIDLPRNTALTLLRAWIKPDDFLDDYFEIAKVNGLEEQQSALNHIQEFRKVRDWTKSLWTQEITHLRGRLSLAYRNQDAEKINAILYLPTLQQNAITLLLDLFPDHAREVPALDRLIEQVKTSELGLPHTTNNNFDF